MTAYKCFVLAGFEKRLTISVAGGKILVVQMVAGEKALGRR